jgi:hypothetical protein
MRRDIYTLQATGMTLAEIGQWVRYVSQRLTNMECRKLRGCRKSQGVPNRHRRGDSDTGRICRITATT